MRDPSQRGGIHKPSTPERASGSSGYSSASSPSGSRLNSPDRGRSGYPSRPGSSRSRPSSSRSSTRRKHAWKEQIPPDRKPLAYTQFKGARYLHPERLPSSKPEPITALRLWENTRISIGCLRQIGPGLVALDLRKMKLGSVKGELLQTMDSLHTLNLENNNLSDRSFDKDCQSMVGLVELRLDDNQLTTLPKILCFKTVRRLSMARNQVSSLQGFEKMKKLQILTVEGNRVKTINPEFFHNLRRLEVLYISENSVSDVPGNIRFSKHLRVVDFSHNNLVTIPAELLKLPHLEELNLSSNRICRMPNLTVGAPTKHQIQSIDLSENQLARFPDFLLFMASHIDLSCNNIKFISGDIFHSLQDDSTKRLELHGNPSVLPPASECENGFRSLVRYFQEQKVNSKVYRGLKCYLVGSYMCGKTSLLQSMLDENPRLEAESERTELVDIVNMNVSYLENSDEGTSSVNLSWWDFSGNTFYQFSQLFFLQHPGLVVLAVDLSMYDKRDFYDSVGTWLEWLFCKTENLVLIVVGTKCDRLEKPEVKERKKLLMDHINEYIRSKFAEIEKEVEDIETKPHISAALSEQLKNYRSLLKLKQNMILHPVVMTTSAKTTQGLPELQVLIQQLIRRQDLFPKFMSVVPSLWTDVESFIIDQGHTMPFPVVPWSTFSELIVKQFGMKNAVESIANYLHDVGKILYKSSDITFSEYVVLRPTFVIELLKNLYRDDMEENFEVIRDSLKKNSVTPSKVENMKKDFLENGIVDRRVLQAVWSSVILDEDNVNKAINYLILKFGVAYSIGAKKKDGTYTLSVIKDESTEGSDRPDSTATAKLSPSPKSGRRSALDRHETTQNHVLLPWLVRTDEEMPEDNSQLTIEAVFRFPKYIPVGLFERYIVRVHEEQTWIFEKHWKHGILGRHVCEPLNIRVSRVFSEENVGLVTLCVVYTGQEPNLNLQVELVWSSLLPLIQDLELFLESFPGAFFQRFMFCPRCHELGFVGEWLSPKELQCIPTKPCMKCGQSVNTQLIVQPKEKRGLDLEQIRRERQRRRTLHEIRPGSSALAQSRSSKSGAKPAGVTTVTSGVTTMKSGDVVVETLDDDVIKPHDCSRTNLQVAY